MEAWGGFGINLVNQGAHRHAREFGVVLEEGLVGNAG